MPFFTPSRRDGQSPGKICEIDPLLCPESGGDMRIIAFIEEEAVIQRILEHLKLWKSRSRGRRHQCPIS
jgi:hypothetical protein